VANPETILITGASAGIGLALTKLWLERGDRVLALQRRSSPLLGHPHYRELRADLAQLEALPAQVRELVSGVHELHRVVLNAAIAAPLRDMADTPLSDLKQLMDVNTWANKQVLDALYGSGARIRQVIGISSGAAVRGSRGWNGYSLSKAAFAMLIQLYAAERPETHFCSLMPGIVQTQMQDDLAETTPEQRQKFPALQRLLAARGTPDMPLPDAAAPALLAAFDRALKEPSGALLNLRELQGG
jgi:NAD(P)-dependent dehydrogenase (short-subunit alcohol dehydrogenase family)